MKRKITSIFIICCFLLTALFGSPALGMKSTENNAEQEIDEKTTEIEAFRPIAKVWGSYAGTYSEDSHLLFIHNNVMIRGVTKTVGFKVSSHDFPAGSQIGMAMVFFIGIFNKEVAPNGEAHCFFNGIAIGITF